MDGLLERHSLEEVCALQWKTCVDRADDAFAQMHDERFIQVTYEDLVCNPVDQLRRIMQFLGTDVPETDLQILASGVSAASIGKGRESLDDDLIARLSPLLK